RQCRSFAHCEGRSEPCSAFCRTESQMMLNPIALKSSRAAIIHVHWQGHCDGALRIHQPVAIVLVDAEVIGNDLKLVTCHSKHVVVVNTHELSAFEYGAKMEVCY